VRERVAEGERVRLREGVRVGERLGVPELVLEVPARKRGDQESKRRSASRMGIDKTEKVGARVVVTSGFTHTHMHKIRSKGARFKRLIVNV
jgi:hypothetical protein